MTRADRQERDPRTDPLGRHRPEIHGNGRVTVDMGAPQRDPAKVPFTTDGLEARSLGVSKNGL
jgi:diaminopimelate epimerase